MDRKEYAKKFPLSFVAFEEETKDEEYVWCGESRLVREEMIGSYLEWFMRHATDEDIAIYRKRVTDKIKR